MAHVPALDRARQVLKSNQYFALATVDSEGPWVATLGYTVGFPNFLYFFSEKASRHGRALIKGGAIAGVIYDSRCKPEDAESLQFAGKGELAHNSTIVEEVLTRAAQLNGRAMPTPNDIHEALANTSTLLFRASMIEAFVLDQELFACKGIDGRERIEVEKLFADLDK